MTSESAYIVRESRPIADPSGAVVHRGDYVECRRYLGRAWAERGILERTQLLGIGGEDSLGQVVLLEGDSEEQVLLTILGA